MATRRAGWFVAAAAVVFTGCGGGPVAPPPLDAPTITCPSDVAARGLPGGEGNVTYPPPTATGGTSPLAVACTPASGSRFASGATTVACTATDARGRQAACVFTVTVTAPVLAVTRFIAFGDSITEGENGRLDAPREPFIDFPNVYPVRLEERLNAEYPGQGIVVLNRGTSGSPVERSVEKLPAVLTADRGDTLLLLDGYNNLLAECTPGRADSPACSRKIADVVLGVRECVRIGRVAAYGIRYVLVSTLTPPGPFAGGPRDRRIAADAIVRTNAALSDMVRNEGAILVDTYARFVGHEAEYVDQDGLHLRPAGYQALADAFFEAIRTQLPATPGTRVRAAEWRSGPRAGEAGR